MFELMNSRNSALTLNRIERRSFGVKIQRTSSKVRSRGGRKLSRTALHYIIRRQSAYKYCNTTMQFRVRAGSSGVVPENLGSRTGESPNATSRKRRR